METVIFQLDEPYTLSQESVTLTLMIAIHFFKAKFGYRRFSGSDDIT